MTETGFSVENGFFSKEEDQAMAPKRVLRELYELLEEYGPCWYTEDHRNRALTALSTP